MTREYAQSQRLTAHDITVLNMHIHHVENGHAQELVAEKAKTAAVEAEVSWLQQLLNTHTPTNPQ